MEKRQSKLLKAFLIVTVGLAGCTIRTEPAITNSSGSVTSLDEVSLLVSEDSTSARAKLYSALQSGFAANDIALKNDANWIVDYAISRISADSALFDSGSGQSPPQPKPILIVRSPNWTDACKAERTRASIIVFNRGDGEIAKRAVVEAVLCPEDEIPFSQMANALVQNAAQP